MKINFPILIPLVCLLVSCGEKTTSASDPAKVEKVPRIDSAGRVIFPPDSPKLSEIRVEPVRTAAVPLEEIDAPGRIDVNPNRVARVTIPVTGKIVGVSVKVGDPVRQGQTVLLMESSEGDTALAADLQATAAVTQAQAVLIKAQADYDREKDLFEREAVAKKEVLSAEAALAQAKAAVEEARAASLQAQERLELLGLQRGSARQRIAVRAPISGRVLEMSVVPGEFRNDAASPLMTIADLSTVQVVSDVPESSIRYIQPGEHLEVELSAYPGEKLSARVIRIGESVDPSTRTIKVFADLPNGEGRFRQEMFGRIRHVDAVRQLPAVPSSAFVQSGEQTLVYREVTRGTFAPVLVKTGSRVDNLVGILEGLAPNDRIVTDGAMLLKAN